MNKTPFQIDVVDRIRELRRDRGISQSELAAVIEISNGQIGNIESPKFRHKYTLKHLYLISSYFGVSLGYLLTGVTGEIGTEKLIEALIEYD